MAETFGFYDTEELVDGSYDREYVAQQWADYFKLFIGTGVFASPTNQLKVIAGEGMNIIVKKGWAFIEGRWYHNDADLVLPVQPNTTASTITSGVFIQANSANREIKAVIATGRTTPDRESPYYELELAQIQLATGTTSVTDAMITDMRTNENVCGFVKGLLEGVIPTADLFLQFESQFNNWFQSVKNQLDTDAAGHLQNAIDKLNKKTHTNLINPLLETRVVNGITCTSNGDGTYTLNGTATANAYYVVDNNLTLKLGETYKLIGCPGGGAGNLYKLALFDDAGEHQVRTDFGEGSTAYTYDGTYDSFRVHMVVYAGVTVDNLVFKPMLTTDTSATYDDFVSYSGSGELSENVAELTRAVNNNVFTNLLHPTLSTSRLGGITCTDNGDGTYTLSGVSTGWANFDLNCPVTLKANTRYKFVGAPSGGSTAQSSAYRMGLYVNTSGETETGSPVAGDIGNGNTFKVDEDTVVDCHIIVAPNTTMDNLIFKPMLTTHLTAGYDDFVPYSGGSGKLNRDVAEMYKTFSSEYESLRENYESLNTNHNKLNTKVDNLSSTLTTKLNNKVKYNGAPVNSINFKLSGTTLTITTN